MKLLLFLGMCCLSLCGKLSKPPALRNVLGISVLRLQSLSCQVGLLLVLGLPYKLGLLG